MTRPGLTREQILDFIAEHTAEKGYPPTVREVGDAVGLASPSTVVAHIRSLKAEGRLTYVEGSPRTLRVVPQEEVTA